jgi:hypothetical protein
MQGRLGGVTVVHTSLLGVSLMYVLQLSGQFQWTVRQSAEVSLSSCCIRLLVDLHASSARSSCNDTACTYIVQVANQMVSVERILQYCAIDQEPPLASVHPPPPAWPHGGELIFDNVGHPSSTDICKTRDVPTYKCRLINGSASGVHVRCGRGIERVWNLCYVG